MALVLLLTLGSPKQAAWADEGKPDYQAAKNHYLAAENAAKAKNWAVAAKEYGVAYEITRDPVLFFKLGNAYQLSGDCTRAVEYLERYIAEAKPSEEYKADARSRISSCNAAAATSEGNKAPKSKPETKPPVGDQVPGLEEAGQEKSASDIVGADSEQVGQPTFIDDAPTWQETAAWTSVGVSVALLSASAILGLSANSREEDIDNLFRYRDMNGNPAAYDATVQKRYEDLVKEGEDLNTLSMVALGLAGVSTASAIAFFVLDSVASRETDGLSTITPTLTNESVGVTAGWAF